GTVAERLGYPADARLLVLHADDLGMTHSTNVATFHALEAGLIQSASILVTAPWLPEVADWARRHPEHDLGVHLAVTSEWPPYRFRPVSGAQAVPSLVDALGYLPMTQAEVEARATSEDLIRELGAQIELARATGITLTHLDSHMLALFWNARLFAAYVEVSTRYGLPVLLPERAPLRLVDQIIAITPDVPHAQWRDWYERTLSALGPGVYEVLLHLSADTEEMQAATEHIDGWGAAFRARDLAVVSDPAFQAFLKQQGFRLVTWRQLAQASCRGPKRAD
ncbi:MAG TPA: polysaccharide deacetylase family protein, partial [Polyangiales bacterium]|nr:polysaccharide deacetylase family protein [Polyangiales bacterium]